MGKIIFAFDADDVEDRLACKRATNATNAYLALWSIQEDILRQKLKYGTYTKSERALLDKILDEFIEIRDKYSIDFDDLL